MLSGHEAIPYNQCLMKLESAYTELEVCHSKLSSLLHYRMSVIAVHKAVWITLLAGYGFCTALSFVCVSLSSFLACNSRLRSAICRHHPPQRRFWAKSAASGSVRWCCFRSCWTVLSHVVRGRPSCLLQSAGREANKILLDLHCRPCT